MHTCIPKSEGVETVGKQLERDGTSKDKSSFTPDHICTLLDLCLSITYSKCNVQLYRRKHECDLGPVMSLIIANIYMDELERRALNSYKGTPSHWFRSVVDSWVKIQITEVDTFTEHINSVDNIKSTRGCRKQQVAIFGLCCAYQEH